MVIPKKVNYKMDTLYQEINMIKISKHNIFKFLEFKLINEKNNNPCNLVPLIFENEIFISNLTN